MDICTAQITLAELGHAQLVGRAPEAREVDVRRLHPRWCAARQPLLVHLVAGQTVRKPVHHARPLPQRVDDAVADALVVPGEVELGVAVGREVHPVRVRDANLAVADRQLDRRVGVLAAATGRPYAPRSGGSSKDAGVARSGLAVLPILVVAVYGTKRIRNSDRTRRISRVPEGWVPARGVVVDERLRTTGRLTADGQPERMHQPVITFQSADGREVTFKSRLRATAMPRPGALVGVYHDPADPTRACIAPGIVARGGGADGARRAVRSRIHLVPRGVDHGCTGAWSCSMPDHRNGLITQRRDSPRGPPRSTARTPGRGGASDRAGC